MRITVMILGLILGAIMFVQTFLVYALSSAVDQEASSQAGAVGAFMALLWLVACGLAIPAPLVSVVLFVVAGLLGFVASGEFPDLALWGGVSLFLAVLSFFGWRGKRKADRRERERDAMLARLAGVGRPVAATGLVVAEAAPTTYCRNCGARLPASSRYCPDCGAARSADEPRSAGA